MYDTCSTHAMKTVTNFFDYMFIKCIILHPTYNTLDGTQSKLENLLENSGDNLTVDYIVSCAHMREF